MQTSEDILDLLPRIRKAWSADTSATPMLWTDENPSLGQSEITALLLQDRAGGELVEGCYVTPSGERGVHIWNNFDGWLFDATGQQYPKGTKLTVLDAKLDRLKVIVDKYTRVRYRKLKARLAEVV